MGIGVTELLVILGICAVLFGTGKLRSMGGDIGGAIRGFRSAMQQEPVEPEKLTDGKGQ